MGLTCKTCGDVMPENKRGWLYCAFCGERMRERMIRDGYLRPWNEGLRLRERARRRGGVSVAWARVGAWEEWLETELGDGDE